MSKFKTFEHLYNFYKNEKNIEVLNNWQIEEFIWRIKLGGRYRWNIC